MFSSVHCTWICKNTYVYVDITKGVLCLEHEFQNKDPITYLPIITIWNAATKAANNDNGSLFAISEPIQWPEGVKRRRSSPHHPPPPTYLPPPAVDLAIKAIFLSKTNRKRKTIGASNAASDKDYELWLEWLGLLFPLEHETFDNSPGSRIFLGSCYHSRIPRWTLVESSLHTL